MTDQAAKNEQALRTFADEFDPPLKVVPTQNIGGQRVAFGYMAAYWDPGREVGVTALCWGRGHFKAYIEATGSSDVAGEAGRNMSAAVADYADPQH